MSVFNQLLITEGPGAVHPGELPAGTNEPSPILERDYAALEARDRERNRWITLGCFAAGAVTAIIFHKPIAQTLQRVIDAQPTQQQVDGHALPGQLPDNDPRHGNASTPSHELGESPLGFSQDHQPESNLGSAPNPELSATQLPSLPAISISK